ncbi:S8 family peptidase [Hymenobacter sediminis]|uniref:S8 family peptidase n=1 Tax=Hymenobacter sediminis TaxID=2218621 RepID=UPI000DA68CBA|nr:S8 family peptidase [Hymenobacter sediminis]RPD44871.1 S8 family peptidase [Hymenobacter sediminis]
MNNKKHFSIPSELVRSSPVVKGGGGKPYTRDDYKSHGESLVQQSDEVKQLIESKLDAQLVNFYVLQLTTPSDVKIKSQVSILNNLGFDIISLSASDQTQAIVEIDKSKFNRLSQKIKGYANAEGNPGKSQLAIIENIKEVPVAEKLNSIIIENLDIEVEFLISIYNKFNRQNKEEVVKSIYRSLVEGGAKGVISERYENGSMIVSGVASVRQLKDVGQSYSTIRSISLNSQFHANQSIPAGDLPNSLQVLQPKTNVKVAVIDSGVQANKNLLTDLVSEAYDYTSTGLGDAFAHGTLVASRIIFGDDILSSLVTGQLEPICKVIDIKVFGIRPDGNMQGPTIQGLASILQDIIPKIYKQAKIFNLSLGLQIPIEDNSISLVAHLIDFFSRKYDILFVIASGNIIDPVGSHPDQFGHPSARICTPAESILGLTVGSVTKKHDDTSICRQNQLSPFSRVGPGADRGMKPELVAHGGNLSAGWATNPDIGAYGLNETGTGFAFNVGTSFSAPIISSYAALLFHEYEDASVNLVKALLLHFSNTIDCDNIKGARKINMCGFGEPNLDLCLHPRSNAATFIYNGSIKKDTYNEIPFYVPKCMAEDKDDTSLQIKVTVVYNPPTDPDNALYYCQTRLGVELYKNTASGARKVSFTSTDERYTNEWSPIVSFAKNFKKSYASGDWYIKLRAYGRGGIDANFTQDFVSIIEVIDTKGMGRVYDDVENSWEEVRATQDVVARVA